MSPDRDLTHLYPDFRVRVERILSALTDYCAKHYPEYRPIVTEGFRSTKRQQEIYAQGRTKPGKIVTQKNGTTNRSNHQSALAVDIAWKRSGTVRWDVPDELWNYLGHCARKEGLVWGGDWKSLVDKPHIEWSTSDKSTYQKASVWAKSAGLK